MSTFGWEAPLKCVKDVKQLVNESQGQVFHAAK